MQLVVIRATSSRRLIPGTTGWTVGDLADPQIESEWESNSYEILEGVLTPMPPAYFDGTRSLLKLVDAVRRHFDWSDDAGVFSFEPDLVLEENRVVKVDAVFLTPDDERRQRAVNPQPDRLVYGRLMVPPTLVIECISIGHESHDEQTKRAWYAQFGIPNYWLLNPYRRTLQCLLLDGQTYRVDQEGQKEDELHPTLFPGLVLKLSTLWVS